MADRCRASILWDDLQAMWGRAIDASRAGDLDDACLWADLVAETFFDWQHAAGLES